MCAPAFAETQPGLADITRTAAAESIVLLKNDHQLLPLSPDRKISVFGRIQVDYFACGYGSGGDVKTPYTVNILDALRKHPGITINTMLGETYEAWCAQNPPDNGSWGNWPLNHPEMPLSNALMAQAAADSDVAVVIIGRSAGEDREAKLEPGSYYLTDAEKSMLEAVDRHYKHIAVLVNSGNIIDMAWVDDYAHIESLLYIWQGGMQGGKAVADILSGDVSPSGKLSSTIAKSYSDYPTSGTSGGEKIFGGHDFSNYMEDIYVGYRYFETFAQDRVRYPFGSGLSYTDFEITVEQVSESDGMITVDVSVKNSGSTYSGKEVVQVYYGAPQGLLGKAARSLAAFAKTGTLAPGDSERMQFSIRIDNMASYDDAGLTGHKSSYVLEAGEYPLYIGSSVRNAVQAGMHIENKLRVTQSLTEIAAVPEESGFQRMKAALDGAGRLIQVSEMVPTQTVSVTEIIERNLPRKIKQTRGKGLTLMDVRENPKRMKDFIAQCSVEEIAALCRGDFTMNSSLGAAGNAAVYGGVLPTLRDKGVVPVTAIDGPSGIRLTASASLLPIGTALACTWNTDLVESMYRMVGREMLQNGADVLLAPGMNIQRDPLGGRNFEYFSEDPLLTGEMAAGVVRGLQSQGVSATPKHFAMNNQETQRRHNDSRCSERAIREIYTKPFEIVVRTAHPHNLMASYNRINGVYSHYHYDLVTRLLREEWGYQGVVMTDWWIQSGTNPDNERIYDNAYRVQAQVDVLMPGEGPKDGKADRSLMESYESGKGITLGEMQRCAVNVLNYVIKSPAFRKANGLAPFDYHPDEHWFSVHKPAPETAQLTAVKLNGKTFSGFNPMIRDYDLYSPDTAALPACSAEAMEGARVDITQPTAAQPVATINVSNGAEKNTYRIYFTDAAGLAPCVENPVYARISDLQINGKSLPQFYPGIYEYRIGVPNVQDAVVTAEVPEGVTYRITKPADRDGVVVRAESPHQAMEYRIYMTPSEEAAVSENDPIRIASSGITKIEAEDYLFKTDSLRTQPCEDAGGGLNVGYVAKDNYLLYEISVRKGGTYSISPRIASHAGGVSQLSYRIEIDGETVASFTHGATGGWQEWKSIPAKEFLLDEGTHKMRVYFDSSDINLNYLLLRRSS